MKQNDFVYNSICDAAIKQDALPWLARRKANEGLSLYKQSSFCDKTPGQMIKRLINEAVKETKAFNKAKGK